MADSPKLLSLLGICRRAGKLACGHDAAVASLRSRSACLCLLSSDASERLRGEMAREAERSGAPVPTVTLSSTMDEIGHATGLKSAVLTVNDTGFAQSMRRLLENTDGRNTHDS